MQNAMDTLALNRDRRQYRRQCWLVIIVCLFAGLTACAKPPSTPPPTPVVVAPLTPAPVQPAFGPIVFGLGIADDARIVRSGTTFPEGIFKVYAAFEHRGMASDVVWRREWYFNGERLEDASASEHWTRPAQGNTWLSMFHAHGLRPGSWELRLTIGDQLVQRGGFQVVPRAPGDPVFKPITFARRTSSTMEPIEPRIQFSTGITMVHGIFQVENLVPGTTFERVWFFNGEERLRGRETVGVPPKDVYDAVLFVNEGAFAPGTYTLEIYHQGQLAQAGSFTVK